PTSREPDRRRVRRLRTQPPACCAMGPRRSKCLQDWPQLRTTRSRASAGTRPKRRRARSKAKGKGVPGQSSVHFLSEEIEQDPDEISSALPFQHRIFSIDDGHWHLDIAQAAAGYLGKNFGGVRHAVLSQPQRQGASSGKGAQTVMCIG